MFFCNLSAAFCKDKADIFGLQLIHRIDVFQPCERLRELVPENIVFVSESGIKTPEDVGRLYQNKTDAVLIGETLMRSSNKKAELEKLSSMC